MKEISSESKSFSLNEILNKEAEKFTSEFINLDSNSKHFLAGYIAAKNERRDIQVNEGEVELSER